MWNRSQSRWSASMTYWWWEEARQGAAAAISAARQGAKTLVLESSHGLGGLGTVGYVSTYFAGYRSGFTLEIDAGVAALGGLPPWRETCWNIEAKMEWYRRELRKSRRRNLAACSGNRRFGRGRPGMRSDCGYQ